MQILVIDDSAALRLQMAHILKSMDHEVVGQAGNYEDAIQQFKEHSPDLVFLDLIMPDTHGHDVLKGILAIDPDANVIIISSMGTASEIEKSLSLGAINFIQKPCTEDKLTTALNAFV